MKGLKRLGMRSLTDIEGQEAYATSPEEKGSFVLKYQDLEVGTLWLKEGVWHFEYTQAFKEQDRLEPLDNFPDRHKHYESESLWPFFALRIPGKEQVIVKEAIDRSASGALSKVEMLKLFGKRTISNSFDLEAV